MIARKQYSKEFKLDAVSLVLEQGYTRAVAARSLELNWGAGSESIGKIATDRHSEVTAS